LKKNLLSALRYVVTLAFALGILWWLFRNIELADFLSRLDQVQYGWIYASIGISFVGYWARAYRWNLLFKSLDIQVSTFRLVLAVLVGYLANLAFPRMGEVSRCAIVKRTDGISVSTSIGTVVTERAVDVICLLLVLLAALTVEFDKISSLLGEMTSSLLAKLSFGQLFLIGTIGLAFVIAGVWLMVRLKNSLFMSKLRELLIKVWHGVGSIGKLKSPGKFIASTLAMWVSYFFMSYIIVFALEETSFLDLKAGLVLLAMGGIGMAMPVQGGIGTYHAFVAGILLWYGINEQTGVFFATLLHTSQVVTVLALGGLSMLVVVFLKTKKQSIDSPEDQKQGAGQ